MVYIRLRILHENGGKWRCAERNPLEYNAVTHVPHYWNCFAAPAG